MPIPAKEPDARLYLTDDLAFALKHPELYADYYQQLLGNPAFDMRTRIQQARVFYTQLENFLEMFPPDTKKSDA